MIHRLANVLYWFFSGIAALIFGLGAHYSFIERSPPDWENMGAVLIGTAAAWLIGRAFLYILSGK